MNQRPVNYITHLNAVMALLFNNPAIRPAHVSLYMYLFVKWNNSYFKDTMHVPRCKLLRQSKINSPNTLKKLLTELQSFGLIKYMASYNSFTGSSVRMIRFDSDTQSVSVQASKDNDTGACTNDVQDIIYTNNRKKHVTESVNKNPRQKNGLTLPILTSNIKRISEPIKQPKKYDEPF